jgi:4-amino-4-deoxy-L-arabinose transferase-like glycosyltransferase
MRDISPLLIRIAVMVAVPSIACFGYYSLAGVGDQSGPWVVPMILAYPLALIGAIGLGMALLAQKRSTKRIWIAAACLVVPVVFILFMRA